MQNKLKILVFNLVLQFMLYIIKCWTENIISNYFDMQNLRNIVVTGSNKGVGFGIVENLAQKEGWNIIMACRNVELANKSRDQLL